VINKSSFLLFSIICICPLISIAQADVPFGARAAALGNASVTIHDGWALYNNVAGIAALKQPEVGVYAENRLGINAFNTVALQTIYPIKNYGNYGFSLSRFGDKLYSRQHLGIGAGHKLGQFSIGAKIELWQVSVEGYGSRKAITLSVGGQAEIIPNLFFGAYAYNLNQAKLADFEDERMPTIMKAGLGYRPSPKLYLAIETEKNIDHAADFKAGIEYQLMHEKAWLRTGFNTLTSTVTAGAGFQARHLQVNYAFGATTPLGANHHLSVSYKFRKED
jgi:hypothetical protein